MAAFRKAVKSLERYYESLPPESERAKHLYPRSIFPYPTSFTSLDTRSETVFSYTDQLEEDEGQSKRLIFFGTVAEGRTEVPICIKFVRHYSRDAHLHCAQSGVAPNLRGFEQLPGGWFMVVMDRILAYDVLADLPCTVCLPRSMFEAIAKQLKTLHARNLVHGDIRDTNILVNQNDRTKFMIIDFDWAGVDGVVVYPPYVNRTNIHRPDDARDGMPIKAAHDNAMIEFIIDTRAEK
jgi:Lipopolysaccharide kinase (Kdo/WaaP) family